MAEHEKTSIGQTTIRTLIFQDGTVGSPVTLKLVGANVIVSNLPTTDPHVAGALWANSRLLTVSNG
jgi:hypothetical protein